MLVNGIPSKAKIILIVARHTITPTAGANGTVTPATPQSVYEGDNITFTIAAAPNYRVVDVGVDGLSVGVTGSYSFSGVNADHTISATFAIDTYKLTVNKVGTGSGSVSSVPAGIECGADCDQEYDAGTAVTVNATADANSTFDGWSEDCDAAGRVTMDAAKSCTATFAANAPNTHTLTVRAAGTGAGNVTSMPKGIDCGTACSAVFGSGASLSLTASPDANSTFDGWSGDCNSSGQVTMTAAKSCTATFDLKEHSLTVARAGTGAGTVSSDPAGIDCGLDCNENFGHGTAVTLTAVADTDSMFSGWNGDCESSGEVTMIAARSCTATFGLKEHSLTVARAGTGSGTVSSDPAGIDCGVDCDADFRYGAVVTLTASADSSSMFSGWSGDCGSSGEVTMTTAKSCTATFAPKQSTLTVKKAGSCDGSVSSAPTGINCGVDCSEAFSHGTVVTLTVTANIVSVFTEWSGACSSHGVVTMDGAKNCTARFALKKPDKIQSIYLPIIIR